MYSIDFKFHVKTPELVFAFPGKSEDIEKIKLENVYQPCKDLHHIAACGEFGQI